MASTLNTPALEPVDHLLLELSAGRLPETLTKEEVAMLVKDVGKKWFKELGYDSTHKLPVF